MEPTVVFTFKELASVENLYHVELNKISKNSYFHSEKAWKENGGTRD